MNADQKIARRAAARLGLVTHDDVRKAGISARSWQRRVAQGVWVRVAPLVYASPMAPRTFEQLVRAHVLSAGRGAAVSHRSAAFLHGFDGFGGERVVHISVPDVRRLAPRSGAIVHSREDLTTADITAVRTLRVTTPIRTIIDLASCATERELENAVDSAVRNRQLTIALLQLRLAELRDSGWAGVRTLDRVLDVLPKGELHTRLERDYLALSRLVGCPKYPASWCCGKARSLWPASISPIRHFA